MVEGPNPLAVIPMGVVWVFGLILVLSIRPLRRSRTPWPPDLARMLLRPTYPKLLFYGLEAFLVFASAYEFISEHSLAQFGFLVAGGVAQFFLCSNAARRYGRTEWLLPLAFAAPIGLSGVFAYAILWYVAGLAGVMVGANRPVRAMWLGAATFALLCARSVQRTLKAIEYRDVAHVTIQGGVAGAATWVLVSLLLSLACLLLIRRASKRSDAPRSERAS